MIVVAGFEAPRVPAAGAVADAASGNSDGETSPTGAGPTDQDCIAMLGDETYAGEIVDECLINRRTLELEDIQVFGERQPGDGDPSNQQRS